MKFVSHNSAESTKNLMKKLITVILLPFLIFHSISVLGQKTDLRFFAGKWDFRIWFTGNTSDKPDLNATWILEKGLDSTECYVGNVKISDSNFTREIIAFDTEQNEYVRTV